MVRQDWGNKLHYGVDEAWDAFDSTDRYIDEDDLRARAALALTIPPPEVAAWILENCQIIMVEQGKMVHPESVEGKYLLLFGDAYILNVSMHRAIHGILHEAAHAYLGHGQKSIRWIEEAEEEERQTNRPVAQWMSAVQYNKGWVEKKLSGRT